MSNGVLLWTKPTESGLGDRLIDMSLLLGMARAQNRMLVLGWGRYADDKAHVAHRYEDIKFVNVQRHIRFPDCVFVSNEDLGGFKASIASGSAYVFDTYLGGGCPQPRQFHAEFVKDICSYDVYRHHFFSALRAFGFSPAIESFLSTLPPGLVSLHVRRGDKVRPQAFDHTQVSEHQVDEMNQRTRQLIDRTLAQGVKNFFVCGDEDEKKMPFVEQIRAAGGQIVQLPGGLAKWQETYYDLAVMSRSDTILVSQMYSSFSRFACLIGKRDIRYAFSNIIHDD